MVIKFSFFTISRFITVLTKPVTGRHSMSVETNAISAFILLNTTLALPCNLSLSNQAEKTREEMVFTITLE
jgi:hypothetical protein